MTTDYLEYFYYKEIFGAKNNRPVKKGKI